MALKRFLKLVLLPDAYGSAAVKKKNLKAVSHAVSLTEFVTVKQN